MAAVHIREVAPQVLEALERRARRHQRSLEGELRSILEEVAGAEVPIGPLPPLRLNLSSAAPKSNWSRAEIYEDDGASLEILDLASTDDAPSTATSS